MLFLGLVSFEVHYAVYPPGTHYEKHRDRFRTSAERVLTAIVYLNEEWRADDGGSLRIYLSEDCTRYHDVLPAAGMFVLFRSEMLLHEVLPARRERFSLTGWLRRR